MLELTINGVAHRVDAPPEMPLLWVVRDLLGLTGTKYGCGTGQCGACTVHVDGVATRSCTVHAGAVGGKRITTIEGLGASAAELALRAAWVAESVPQCGYCQPGQLMSAAALLATTAEPGAAEIHAAMGGNLCVCGCYARIERAIARAARPT
jgi:isoquinoline 1-oxidoreductase alpha subunit